MTIINNVIWEFKKSKITDQELLTIENYFYIKLPDDLKKCVIQNNGACPNPSNFILNKRQEQFRRLLSFKQDDDTFILNTYENTKKYLPKMTFPFAEDSGGNLICLKYLSRSDSNPKIIFWEHELYDDSDKSIHTICNSFTELLFLLQPLR